jgi:hypothetical protein
MKLQKIKISKAGLHSSFLYFNKVLIEEGVSALYSKFIFENFNLLKEKFLEIDSEIKSLKNENKTHPDFLEYLKKREAIIPNGTNGEDVTHEQTRAIRMLEKEYESIISSVARKEKENIKKFEEIVEVEVYVLDLEEFINTAPPTIVGNYSTDKWKESTKG